MTNDEDNRRSVGGRCQQGDRKNEREACNQNNRFHRRDQYNRSMLKTIPILLLFTSAAFAQDSAKDETQVWQLEKAYWEYVNANDLEKYRGLWNENFLGWPFVSSAPVRKDHITDWITANTSKGIKLQSYSIEQLAIQVTGDVAVDDYRINAR